MKNIRLLLEYEGTGFSGWQRQAGDRSVQEELESALGRLTGEQATVHGSGRTDAAVHALGQVASFRTGCSVPSDKLAPALNAHLPPDVAVLASAEVSPDFHARFSALGKTYLYTVYRGAHRPAVRRNFCHHFPYEIDPGALEDACGAFLGRRDFRGFSCAGSPVKDTVRTLQRFEVLFRDPFLFLLLSADGFLYKMARSIVGTVLEVGRGRLEPGTVDQVFRDADRGKAGPTAPGTGLTLLGVRYPDWESPLYGLPVQKAPWVAPP
jgi:tRNA pseudouridine38-40 synthase